MTDRLFSYPDRATAEAVRDALRRIAPAFSIKKGPVADSLDTEGLSRVRHAQPLAEGEDVFWIVGDRRLIALLELAGCVFEKGRLPAARSSLEAIHDHTIESLGEVGRTVPLCQASETEIQDPIKSIGHLEELRDGLVRPVI